MELNEAHEFLSQNNTAIATTVGRTGRAQSTVVTTGLVDGKVAWISRGRTVKVKNIERTGRATVTVIKLDTRRYVTVEGSAVIHEWSDTDATAQVKRLKDVYIAMGRAPKESDEEFAATMAEEKRAVIEVTPDRWYGSLTVR
ncbi:MAG: TIGR03618 family F420-dependent PPOX class oxidoreductase [Chloroflexi bacterium]|nr:TIGR03618 family F420-dependent PPOX class oxidoreductase [Chloroflexota bacterium]